MTSAPLWRTGDKGAPPLPQTLALRKQLQRKTEAPSLAPSQTQLSTGDLINVSKQDEQGRKFALKACRIEDIEETPPARFWDLQYPLCVINAHVFVEYDSAGFVSKWLFDVMMLGKDAIFYGEADVVHRIGRSMQRLWRMEKDKDPTTVPFCHVRLPVYSWLSGPVTSSTYQFDEHCMWIGTTSRWDKQVYLLLSPVKMPLCARGLAHCCLRYSSLFITFTVAELCVVFFWTFRRDAEQEPRWFHASDSRAVVPGQISLGSGYADAVVVVDDTPAMAAKIAMSDVRTKVAFLAVSAIKQKDLGYAVGGALQHAIIMRYMLEADQTEQGAQAATWDTQEEWLQRGIPLWVLDSNRGYEGHQQVHAAEAVQEDAVTEAPADDTEAVAPAPTLPMQAKVKKTAKGIPTQGTAAGKGTPLSSKKRAKGKQKGSDKPAESDDDDADKKEKKEDPEQVLESQQKRKRAPATHFDASPESGKEQPKKKAKTAASASAEFKPPSRSGAQPSRGTVASPSGTSAVARSLGSRLAKVAGLKKK